MDKRKKKFITTVLLAMIFGIFFANTGNVSAYNNTWFSFRFDRIQDEARISGNVRKTDSDPAVVSMYDHKNWIQGRELIALYINPTGKWPTMATNFIHVEYSGRYVLNYSSAYRKSGWNADLSGSLAKSYSNYTWADINGYWCP